MRLVFALFLFAVISGLAPAAAQGDEHYAAVFAAETVPFRSTHTHTFIVVVRVPGSINAEPPAIEMHHISWFPRDLTLRGITLLPEPGRNLSIPATFAQCRKNGMTVSIWGPFRIEPELFELMKRQSAHLSTGSVLYKPTDNCYPSEVAANCYHAIWQPIAPCRKYSGAFNCGNASGAMTLRLFTPWLIRPDETHDWMLPLLVPPGESAIRRDYRDRPGRMDAIRSAVGR